MQVQDCNCSKRIVLKVEQPEAKSSRRHRWPQLGFAKRETGTGKERGGRANLARPPPDQIIMNLMADQ
jgi:hypothetical protein